MKLKTRNLLGTVIVLSAIGIMILNYFTNGDSDSYIMPVILLCLSVVVFSIKHKKEKKQIDLNKKQRNIILSVLSTALISGIVALFLTLL